FRVILPCRYIVDYQAVDQRGGTLYYLGPGGVDRDTEREPAEDAGEDAETAEYDGEDDTGSAEYDAEDEKEEDSPAYSRDAEEDIN
ncbi:MAG: hypothetical protein ILP09_00995, partial [Oscillospiraceae bacterium]|nr:hypothetical protein [Oscillospiraceae bacterium]